jgi:hypothetical protein
VKAAGFGAVVAMLVSPTFTAAQRAERGATPLRVSISELGLGWARSSVNAVVFRTASIASHGSAQYAAYYDDSAHVVLAMRRIGSPHWTVVRTSYTNDVTDAHNAIAIAVDGSGVLHVAWAEHNKDLHYARAVRAGSLTLGPAEPMTGRREARVTYPQFYTLPGGDLLFVYRDGQSGRGDVLLDRYDVRARAWRVLHHPLIAGEGRRNAYVNQLAIDAHGGWHLSWVWRESPDVATNHDVLYAYSADEGRSWRRSSGEAYTLPIVASSAEVAWAVPQGSELINQTSAATDPRDRPLIATYWRDTASEVPQLRIVWHDGMRWRSSRVGDRTLAFRLSGGGTKRIPLSRPQVLVARTGEVLVVYRDEERGGGITVARSRGPALDRWTVADLWPFAMGQWEPTYDLDRWRRERRLSLFVQRVGQGDGESLEDIGPQRVSVLDWVP